MLLFVVLELHLVQDVSGLFLLDLALQIFLNLLSSDVLLQMELRVGYLVYLLDVFVLLLGALNLLDIFQLLC